MNRKNFAKRLVMLALMLVLGAVVLPTQARADATKTVNPGNFEFRLHSVTCQLCKNVLSYNNSIYIDKANIYVNGGYVTVKYRFSLGSHTGPGGTQCANSFKSFAEQELTFYSPSFSCTKSYSTGQKKVAFNVSTQTFEHVISISRGANGHDVENWSPSGNNQHSAYCNVCRQTVYESCGGGSATCTSPAVCTTCDGSYVNASGHNWSSWKSNGDNTHTRTCSYNSSHTEKKSCSGGEAATCVAKSVCSTCNTAYGNFADHAWSGYTPNNDGTHTHVCANSASHNVKETCSGGEAATCVAKSVCSKCDTAYGSFADHAWSGYSSNGDGTHTHVCANSASHNVVSDCSGGTATCTDKPVCSICKESYGKKLGHDPIYSNENADHILEEACSRCDHAGTAALTFTAGGSQHTAAYTGSGIKPMKVTYSNWLGEQQHDIQYADNINIGTATGSFSHKGITASRSFTVAPKALELSMVSMAAASGTYNGSAHAPSFSLSYNGMTLEAGKDYSAGQWPDDMTNAGSKTLQLTGMGNYSGKITVTYEIKPRVIKVIPTAGQEMTYGQDVPELTYKISGLVDGEVPAVSGRLMPANTNAGTPAIQQSTLTLLDNGRFLADNYAVGFTSGVTLQIHQAEAALSLSVQDQDYDGAAVSCAPSGADLLYTYTGDGDVSVKWYADDNGAKGQQINAPTDVGTYHVGVSAAAGNNYKAVAEQTASFEINKVDPALTGPTGKTLDYNLGAQELVTGATNGGTLQYSMDGTTWSTEIPTGTDAGEYTVYWRVVGDRNFNDNDGGSVTATIRTIPIVYTAEDTAKTYDGAPAGITVAITEPEGTTLLYKDANGSYTLTEAPQFTDAGTYAVGFQITKKNYTTVTDSRTVEISPRPVTVRGIQAEDKIYDGTTEARLDLSAVTVGNAVTGETVTLESVTGTFDTKDAGTGKTVTLSDFKLSDDNYCLNTETSVSQVNASIAPMEITVTITPNGGVYEAVTPAAVKVNETTPDEVAVTLTYSGTANDGTAVNDDTAVPTLAGTYTVAASITDGNYALTGETTAAFLIGKAEQAAPVLTKQDETISRKQDGSISGIAPNMEYRTGDAETYTLANESVLEGLGQCSYRFRYVETPNHNPSPDTLVEIAAGRKLLVKVPAVQAGYTLTTATAEVDWHGEFQVEFKLAEGYETTDAFQISESGVAVLEQFQNGVLTVSQIERDYEFTVTGIEDHTAPQLTLDVSGEEWSALSTDDTFDDFVNKDLAVTLEASDLGSGIKTLEYLVATEAMTAEELEKAEGWKPYTRKLTFSQEQGYIIYARATDASGNRTYVGSDAIVLDKTAPAVTGIENGGIYYTTQAFTVTDDHAFTVTLDGKQIKTLKISGDPKEDTKHTLKAVDEAGNETVIKITVKPINSLRKSLPTEETVELEDKKPIAAIRTKTAAVDTEDATDAEKKKLNGILADCDALTEEIEAAEAVIALIGVIPDTEDLEPDNAEHLQKYVTAEAEFDDLSECAQRMVGAYADTLEDAYDALTDYRIIKGDKSKYTKPGWKGLSFTANGPVKAALEEGTVSFKGILLDGKTLDPSKYTVKSGSTVVTLRKELLNKLSLGKHKIVFVYDFMGTEIESDVATFRITSNSGNPKTGDGTEWLLPMSITAVVSLACAAMLMAYGSKKRRKQR